MDALIVFLLVFFLVRYVMKMQKRDNDLTARNGALEDIIDKFTHNDD